MSQFAWRWSTSHLNGLGSEELRACRTRCCHRNPIAFGDLDFLPRNTFQRTVRNDTTAPASVATHPYRKKNGRGNGSATSQEADTVEASRTNRVNRSVEAFYWR